MSLIVTIKSLINCFYNSRGYISRLIVTVISINEIVEV